MWGSYLLHGEAIHGWEIHLCCRVSFNKRFGGVLQRCISWYCRDQRVRCFPVALSTVYLALLTVYHPHIFFFFFSSYSSSLSFCFSLEFQGWRRFSESRSQISKTSRYGVHLQIQCRGNIRRQLQVCQKIWIAQIKLYKYESCWIMFFLIACCFYFSFFQ